MSIKDSIGWQITILSITTIAGLSYLFFNLLVDNDPDQPGPVQSERGQVDANTDTRSPDSFFVGSIDETDNENVSSTDIVLQQNSQQPNNTNDIQRDLGSYQEDVFTIDNSSETSNGSGSDAVYGQCGETRYSCSVGSYRYDNDTDTEYKWLCAGSRGGSIAECSEPKDTDAQLNSTVGTSDTDSYLRSLIPNYDPDDPSTFDLTDPAVISQIQSSVQATESELEREAMERFGISSTSSYYDSADQSQQSSIGNTSANDFLSDAPTDTDSYLRSLIPNYDPDDPSTFDLTDPAVISQIQASVQESSEQIEREYYQSIGSFSTNGYASCGSLPVPSTGSIDGLSENQLRSMIANQGRDNPTAQCMGKSFVDGCSRISATVGSETIYMFSDGPLCRGGMTYGGDMISLCDISPSNNLVSRLEQLGIDISDAETDLSNTLSRLASAESNLSTAKSELEEAETELEETESTDEDEIAELEDNITDLQVEVNTLENNIYSIRAELANLKEQKEETYALIFLFGDFDGNCKQYWVS